MAGSPGTEALKSKLKDPLQSGAGGLLPPENCTGIRAQALGPVQPPFFAQVAHVRADRAEREQHEDVRGRHPTASRPLEDDHRDQADQRRHDAIDVEPRRERAEHGNQPDGADQRRQATSRADQIDGGEQRDHVGGFAPKAPRLGADEVVGARDVGQVFAHELGLALARKGLVPGLLGARMGRDHASLAARLRDGRRFGIPPGPTGTPGSALLVCP
jgi:hypothetical protein